MYVLVEAKSVTPFASSPLMSPLVHWRLTSSFPTCWDSSGPHGSTPYYLNEIGNFLKWKVPQTASQLGAGWMLDARKRKTVRSSAFVPMIWARKYLVKHVLEMLVRNPKEPLSAYVQSCFWKPLAAGCCGRPPLELLPYSLFIFSLTDKLIDFQCS